LKSLKKNDAKPELWRFLKLWLHEGKSKVQVARIIRKNVNAKNPDDVTIVSRRLKSICEHFEIQVEGKGTHEAQLVYLFRKYAPQLVNQSVCPDAVDSSILNRPSIPTKPKNIASNQALTVCNSSFIGRDRVLTELDGLFVQNR
jgi:hypothetical protein